MSGVVYPPEPIGHEEGPRSAAATSRTGRAYLVYLGIVALLALGVALSRRAHLPFVLFLVAWSVLLGWPLFRLVSSNLPRLAAWILGVVVGYHALFGPALLFHFLTHPTTRHDDLAVRAWPHVIRWINSFE